MRLSTPWRREGIYIISVGDPGDGGTTAAIAPEGMRESMARWDENSAFIVRAVNMHDELVRAVEHLAFVLTMSDALVAMAMQKPTQSEHKAWVAALLERAKA